MQQHSKARRALHQGADRGAAEAQDQITFPVSRHRTVGRLCRTLADHDLGKHEALASSARACPRDPQRPAAAQTRRQFAAQLATPLDEQRLVDGFVADAHGLIVREVNR
jgi:hypothetical protein